MFFYEIEEYSKIILVILSEIIFILLFDLCYDKFFVLMFI